MTNLVTNLTSLVTQKLELSPPFLHICAFNISKVEDARVIVILERMEKNQQQFFAEAIAILRSGNVKPKDWGDIVDVQDLLKKSRRTVYRILGDKKKNPVRTRQILGTTWFYLPDFFVTENKYLK